MVLKKKLIPLTSLGLMSTTLMPISLTSCGNGVIGQAYDLTHRYYPTIEKLSREELTINAVNDVYTENLLKNPEIFVQDYFWSKSWRGSAFEQLFFWTQLFYQEYHPSNANEDKILAGPASEFYYSSKEAISNLSISTQDVTNSEALKLTIPTLSFTLDFDSTVNVGNQYIVDQYLPKYEGVTDYDLEGRVTGKIKFYNIPFRLLERNITFFEHSWPTKVLCFDPYIEWMKNRDPEKFNPQVPTAWRIETSVQSSVFGQIIYETGLVERVADDWSLNILADPNHDWHFLSDLSLNETISTVFTTSYFLQNISLKD